MNRRGPADSMSIALVGTRGVPARYGGFETCVEEVGARLVELGHDVVVYCRRLDESADESVEYRGMRLVHLGAMKKRTLETLSHTGLSVAHLLKHRTDAAIVFNAANAPWLPLLRARGIPFATHVDGLEWQRGKWGRNGRRYYQAAEKLSVRWSDALIADAGGIAEYYRDRYDAGTELIAYGAPILKPDGGSRLGELNLISNQFHLVVARFEPENNVHLIVEGYRLSGATKPLVVVGSAPYSDAYTAQVHASADDRVTFLGGVWDQELLDQLYSNALTYFHGHTVGGTNPSLLRAIGAGAATNAFDVTFNREVLGDSGRYFSNSAHIAELFMEAEADPAIIAARSSAALKRAGAYNWDDVAAKYEDLCRSLVLGGGHRPRGLRLPHIAATDSAPYEPGRATHIDTRLLTK